MSAVLDRMCAADFLEVEPETFVRKVRTVRLRRVPTRMTRAELALFLSPRTLASLPRKSAGGYASCRWAHLAAQAEQDGLIESTGRGALWACTAKGREFVLSS